MATTFDCPIIYAKITYKPKRPLLFGTYELDSSEILSYQLKSFKDAIGKFTDVESGKIVMTACSEEHKGFIMAYHNESGKQVEFPQSWIDKYVGKEKIYTITPEKVNHWRSHWPDTMKLQFIPTIPDYDGLQYEYDSFLWEH